MYSKLGPGMRQLVASMRLELPGQEHPTYGDRYKSVYVGLSHLLVSDATTGELVPAESAKRNQSVFLQPAYKGEVQKGFVIHVVPNSMLLSYGTVPSLLLVNAGEKLPMIPFQLRKDFSADQLANVPVCQLFVVEL